jgi:hypothetical protein
VFRNIGGAGKHLWGLREQCTFMPQTNHSGKVFTVEQLTFKRSKGKCVSRANYQVEETRYRIGYWIVGKKNRRNGQWTWGQFTPSIPAGDLGQLLEKAIRGAPFVDAILVA